MESLFKVGDIVTIKSKFDPGCGVCSYRCNFTKEMLEKYGGKRLKVVNISDDTEDCDSDEIPDDGFTYFLTPLNEERSTGFLWTSSMFKTLPLKKYPNLF